MLVSLEEIVLMSKYSSKTIANTQSAVTTVARIRIFLLSFADNHREHLVKAVRKIVRSAESVLQNIYSQFALRVFFPYALPQIAKNCDFDCKITWQFLIDCL